MKTLQPSVANADHHHTLSAMTNEQQQQTGSLRDRLTIAIVGFGNFGQFLGARFAANGHRYVNITTPQHESDR